MYIVDDWMCEAEFQNELIRAHSEGMPRTQIVSFLSGIFPVSVMIVISSLDFFL